MTLTKTRQVVAARDLPRLGRDEAEQIAYDELSAFVGLLERLDDADWQKPTACDLWNVRDVVAHQGGHVQAGMGLRGMLAQLNPKLLRPYQKRGMNTLDAMNQAQVDMRREWTTESIVAEVREGTVRAIAARQRTKWPSRLVRVPAPDYGLIPIDYLLHVVFPRDMWIHRLDIADATGKPFVLSDEHDGVLVKHVIRDTERNVRKRLPGHAVRLTLEGPAGGTWLLGQGAEIAVTMEVPDFLRSSSGRMNPGQRIEVADVSTADAELKERVLGALVAVY